MQYKDILKRYWGYEDFRGIQQDIVESIGAGHDTLGLMPTGGGKSITFQVPAMAQKGTCIVITPLIALMRDQVMNLRSRGIKATAVYSGMTHNQIVTALENCVLGDYKFLYVSPERIGTELFQTKLRHMTVSFITVDEAHCISQWGYDFRPSYLQIAEIRSIIPNVPILALTASATPDVVIDIQQKLHFRTGYKICRMSFERKNLTYIVRKCDDKQNEMIHILQSLPGSAIIYTRNRQQTQELAEYLIKKGFTATNYHAGLPQVKKDERQSGWQNNRFRIMVATNAFGMGIDKPDVRLVIHYEIPDSPEAYFQEAGRAGRDGKQAYAVLLYNSRDCTKLLKRIGETYPEPDYIRRVYEDICCYFEMAMGDGTGITREFNLQEFCYLFKHFPVQVNSSLLILDKTGIIRYTEDEDVVSRLMFTLNREELYRLQNRSETEERIIHTLLRKYTGLFSELVYIDEYSLAKESGTDYNHVYLTLKQMAHSGIINYIPRKRTNFITFVCRRIEPEEIIFPAEIYADRRKQYERRIQSMIQYVTDKEYCHSRFLLSYFGETNIQDCGRCDICLQDKSTSKDEIEAIRASLLKQIQKGPIAPRDIDYTGFERQRFLQVLRTMLNQEEIILNQEQHFILRQPSSI
ncbi:MAG: RecQ family ATP-dependent DNA helicase [Bacteroidaceae bacterium]|nr:RecQ family ATP-dependent DNA helicase [Bacteroidaceae bacterium]